MWEVPSSEYKKKFSFFASKKLFLALDVDYTFIRSVEYQNCLIDQRYVIPQQLINSYDNSQIFKLTLNGKTQNVIFSLKFIEFLEFLHSEKIYFVLYSQQSSDYLNQFVFFFLIFYFNYLLILFLFYFFFLLYFLYKINLFV